MLSFGSFIFTNIRIKFGFVFFVFNAIKNTGERLDFTSKSGIGAMVPLKQKKKHWIPSVEIKPGKKNRVKNVWRQIVTLRARFRSSFPKTGWKQTENTLTFLTSSITSPSSSTGAQMRLLHATGKKESSVSLKRVPKTSQKACAQCLIADILPIQPPFWN